MVDYVEQREANYFFRGSRVSLDCIVIDDGRRWRIRNTTRS